MSNVVSPRGPLPPKVYWRRRLVLVAVLVGVVLLATRVVAGGDGSDDTAPVADKGSAGASARPTDGVGEPGSRGAAREKAQQRRRQSSGGRRNADGSGNTGNSGNSDGSSDSAGSSVTTDLTGASGPLAPAAGTCKADEVAVAPDVEDTDAYGSVPLRLGLSATGNRACTFELGPDTVALQVTSGDDLIWQTLKCSTVLDEQAVVVRPGWLTYVTVDWSGRRGQEGCGSGDFAQPGFYWAEAAAIGGEPERGQFELEQPPKPKPEKTQKTKDSEQSKEKKRPAGRGSDGPGQDGGR